uniref:protein-serine/threonine phosphatase n=1 Tax=Leersia perrieri TaxID=77586 RepID=A0A0D9VI45_9ORYZ
MRRRRARASAAAAAAAAERRNPTGPMLPRVLRIGGGPRGSTGFAHPRFCFATNSQEEQQNCGEVREDYLIITNSSLLPSPPLLCFPLLQDNLAFLRKASPAMGASASSSGKSKITNEGENQRVKYASSTTQGLSATMQDALAVELNLDVSRSTSFFDVYDGEGGADVAMYCAKRFHAMLCEEENYLSNLPNAIASACSRLDNDLQRSNEWRESLYPRGNGDCFQFLNTGICANLWRSTEETYVAPSYEGSTACVVIIRGNQITVGNVGDSRCVLSKKGQAIDLTIDHKPYVRTERRRIERAGGRVSAQAEESCDAGVCPVFKDYYMCPELLKNQNRDPSEQMVTCVPACRVGDITDGTEFLVIASGGIWSHMSRQQVVDFVRAELRSVQGNLRTTVILVKFKPFARGIPLLSDIEEEPAEHQHSSEGSDQQLGLHNAGDESDETLPLKSSPAMGLSASSPVTSKLTNEGENHRVKYASSTMQGYVELDLDVIRNTSFFGVYDGLGGADVAMYCAKRFHVMLREEEDYPSDIPNAVVSVCLRLEYDLQRSKEWRESLYPHGNDCFQFLGTGLCANPCRSIEANRYAGPLCEGSTACVVIITGNQIVVGNLGDSRCVLSHNGQALDLSTDHKPNDPREFQRIQRAGGQVATNTFPVVSQGETITRTWDVPRVEKKLPVSRAIGYFELKQNKYMSISEQMVICAPELFFGEENLRTTCEKLLDECVNSGDNLTAILVRFKPGVMPRGMVIPLLSDIEEEPDEPQHDSEGVISNTPLDINFTMT